MPRPHSPPARAVRRSAGVTGLLGAVLVLASCGGGALDTAADTPAFTRCVRFAGQSLPADHGSWHAAKVRSYVARPAVLSCTVSSLDARQRSDLLTAAFDGRSADELAGDLGALVAASDPDRKELVSIVGTLAAAADPDRLDGWDADRFDTLLGWAVDTRMHGVPPAYERWRAAHPDGTDQDAVIAFLGQARSAGPAQAEIAARVDRTTRDVTAARTS